MPGAALLVAMTAAACGFEVGPGCPTDLVAEPNGRDQQLFFVGGGYVQDGLWKQLSIPTIVPPDSFTVTTGTIEFHPPSCVTGPSGFPLFDADGNLQCEFDVDTRTSSDSCTLPAVEQDLEDVTVETTSLGTNIVLGVQTLPEGIAIQVGCDVSQNDDRTDPKCPQCGSGVHVVLRQSNGLARYDDTIWITCDRAASFHLNYLGLVGMTAPNLGDGIVHVGDEFIVGYVLQSPDPTRYPAPMGNGMVPVDANPAFEIVAYLYPIGARPELHLRALAPADHPRLKAGTIEGVLPVTIVP